MKQVEIDALYDEIDAALMSGDMERFVALSKKAPMPPEVAEAVKFGFGADALQDMGFNLSAAEAAYGSNWLTK